MVIIDNTCKSIAWEMEETLINDFQQLKISVLSKLEKINSLTKDSNERDICAEENISSPNILIEEGDVRESQKIDEHDKSPIQDCLKTLEVQRRKKVVDNVQSRLKKLEDFTKQQETEKRKQWMKKQQEFMNDIQRKEHHIFEVLEEYDKSSSNSHAQLALYYKNLEIRRQEHENEIRKRERDKRIIYACIDKIKKIQPSFRTVYEQILPNLKRCKKIELLRKLLTEEFKLLNILRSSFEGIVNKCKTGKITECDVEKASELFSQLENLERKIRENVDKINLQVESESKQKEVQVEVPNQPKTVSEEKDLSSISRYVSVTNLKEYVKLMDFFEKFLESFKGLENDPSQKQFILNCKKAINIPVNSLSGLNSEHILDKYNKLCSLLKGQDVVITDKIINASSHPEGISFCINLLVKRFVLQSDLIISSNPESAFCYATVIMSLWNDFPIFGQLLLAYFYKTCPYLVPYHIPRQPGESDEEFYKRQGYQYNNGEIEKQDKFLKRMTGVMRLYAAIMVVKPKQGHKNIYNIQNGWKWLASTLKLEPQVDITATLVHTFLETAGFELEVCYGRVFQKLMRIISEIFLPSCRKKCTGGSVTRLELLLTEYYQKRKFEVPDGYLGYNYW